MKSPDAHPEVVYLTQLFTPEPTFKGSQFAQELAEAGYDIEVVTGFPNYPGGQIYDGYRMRPIRRSVESGLRIVRLATYPSHDRSAVRRILSYVSFMLTSVTYLLCRRRPALIYVYYPSITAGLVAIAIKWLKRVPVIVDIQDMWPDSLSAAGMMKDGRLIRIVELFCQLVYRNADHLVVLSPGFRRTLIERGVPAEKITVVYNWADEAEGQNPGPTKMAAASPFDPSHNFTLLFAGNMGAMQGLDAVLDAAKIVGEERGDIGIYLMGGGVEVERLKARALAERIHAVRFIPRVPLDQVQGILCQAGALLVHLSRDPLFAITVPSKTQAYLYAGRPILMCVEGDAADLVIEGGAGLVVEPENPRALAEAIGRLADLGAAEREAMGARGRSFYDRRLTRKQGLEATLRIIEAYRRPLMPDSTTPRHPA